MQTPAPACVLPPSARARTERSDREEAGSSPGTDGAGRWGRPLLAAPPRVSVVIPAFNEARNLPYVLADIPPWVTEILLVDGCSVDDTVSVAAALRPDIRVIRQPGTGKGDALRAGFEAARGDILLAGYDLVKGSRFLAGGRSMDLTPVRRVGNRCLVWLVRLLLGGAYTDLNYGYAAFWRDLLPVFRLVDESSHLGFEIEALLGVRALVNRLRVAEIPSVEAERIHGKSRLNPVRDGWRVLMAIVRERLARTHPRPPDARIPGTVDVSGMEVSVVICAHDLDRWEVLVAAVESVRAQRVGAAEIIVVVDHNPQLLDQARRQLRDVTVLPNEGSPGISGARNTGVAAARGEVIAFLDDDAVATDDWIEQLRDGYRNPLVLAVGGTVEPLWSGIRPRWLPREFDWVVGCTYRGLPDSAAPVRNLIGCNMSFRRRVFEQAGGFRPELGRAGNDGIGCEETELCVRAGQRWPRQAILFKPEARVRHRIHDARMRWPYFRSRCFAEGRSKALLSSLVGTSDATASERRYVCRMLSVGLLREIGAGLRGDVGGLMRAATMLSGLVFTLCGYVAGRMRERRTALR
jgi:glycosyltransferase involved in cell wall biosynthesis